ncbi:hypothetical protein IWW34DRAFT_810873 [Fusarium oxysporum f. sp. albedinis]|nr:hypothetical protein IWW34DRAFT_810873 [Fusarium oxysporum f. sp. albedinis]
MRLVRLFLSIAFLFFLLFAFYSDSIKSPLDYAHAKAAEFCSEGKFGNCKDPYRRPGYLYVPAEEERYREARWMPFTSKFLDSEDPETAAMRNDGEFGWLWGRRVVSFGDSVDRRAARAVAHGCLSYPAFNLTFTAFHSAGGFTYRPDWFWYKQMRIIPFERRWEELWQPHERDIQGPNGRPDLILWQNGLWDQRGFQVGGQKLHEGQNVTVNGRYRKLVWDELHFVLARTKKYAEMIIRTGSGDIMVIEMDHLGRALAEQYGHEVFEWGRIISLMGHWYEDGTHRGEGALSWLWGNMILEYLARSAKSKLGGDYRFPYFDGWERCHEELVGWGGR